MPRVCRKPLPRPPTRSKLALLLLGLSVAGCAGGVEAENVSAEVSHPKGGGLSIDWAAVFEATHEIIRICLSNTLTEAYCHDTPPAGFFDCSEYCGIHEDHHEERSNHCAICPDGDCERFEPSGQLAGLDVTVPIDHAGNGVVMTVPVHGCGRAREVLQVAGLTRLECEAFKAQVEAGACTKDPPPPQGPRDICWDGHPVESLPAELDMSPATLEEVSRSVGMMSSCSGVLIEGNRFLTAGHCVDNHEQPFVMLGLRRTFANPVGWFQVAERNQYPVLETLENGWTDTDRLDYAIVSLGPNRITGEMPSERFPSARVESSPCGVHSGVAIVTHRPAEQPIQTVDTGHVENFYDKRLTTDLSGGPSSSGSPMFCDGGRLAGVYAGGGCHRRGEGPHMEAILARSPILRGLAEAQ